MFIDTIMVAGLEMIDDHAKNGSSGANDRRAIPWGVGWLNGMGLFWMKERFAYIIMMFMCLPVLSTTVYLTVLLTFILFTSNHSTWPVLGFKLTHYV